MKTGWVSRNAHCGSSKTYATCFARADKLISNSLLQNPDVPGSSSSSSSESISRKAAGAGHPTSELVRGLGSLTYPVSLAVEQRRGLVEHLLEGLLLGDALGKGRSVGVDLGLTAGVSRVARSLGAGAGRTIFSFSLPSFSPGGQVGPIGQTLLSSDEGLGRQLSTESAEWNGLRVSSGAKEGSQYLLRLMRCVRGCAGCGCEEPPARCRVLVGNGGNCGAENGSPPT